MGGGGGARKAVGRTGQRGGKREVEAGVSFLRLLSK